MPGLATCQARHRVLGRLRHAPPLDTYERAVRRSQRRRPAKPRSVGPGTLTTSGQGFCGHPEAGEPSANRGVS